MMKSFSIAVLLALLTQSEAFVSSSVAKRAFLVGAPSCSVQQKPLCVSTELTAESVGQSADDDEKSAEDIPVAVEAVASETPAADKEAKPAVERVRHTLFIGNLPFGTSEKTRLG